MGNCRYRVKFSHFGGFNYGIVDYLAPLCPKGHLIVRDAIKPMTWTVEESDIIDVPFLSNGEKDEYMLYIEKEFKKAQKISNSKKGVRSGRLIKFVVGDSNVYYVITKVGKKQVTLEWRGFSLEDQTEPSLGYVGQMDRQKVEEIVCIENLFGTSYTLTMSQE